MKRTKPYYPIRLKKQAVQMVAAELLSEEEACHKFKISCRLLHQWQRWHDKFFVQPLLNPAPMAKKKLTDQEKIEQLQKQLKETQQQLKYANLKKEAYETMTVAAQFRLLKKNLILPLKKSLARGAPRQTVQKMRQRHPTVGLWVLCGLFGKTRQAYYKAQKRLEQQEEKDQLLLKKVRRIRQEMPGLGTRKLHHLTVSYRKKHDIKMGRDKLYDLLRRENMLITFRKRRTRTTYSDHNYVRYKNLTDDLAITAIDQYVSDITYIPVGSRFAYLSLITDAYSRKIIGWHLLKACTLKGH